MNKAKIKQLILTVAQFLLNPRFLLCFGLGWIITNGWSYILLAIGSFLHIGWMVTVATAYLAFLWLPISPEKIVTLAIAMALLRFFFPNDQKTLGILKRLHEKAHIRKVHRKEEKEEKKHQDQAVPPAEKPRSSSRRLPMGRNLRNTVTY